MKHIKKWHLLRRWSHGHRQRGAVTLDIRTWYRYSR